MPCLLVYSGVMAIVGGLYQKLFLELKERLCTHVLVYILQLDSGYPWVILSCIKLIFPNDNVMSSYSKINVLYMSALYLYSLSFKLRNITIHIFSYINFRNISVLLYESPLTHLDLESFR